MPSVNDYPQGAGSDPGVFQEYQQALPPPRLQLPPAFHKLILHIITQASPPPGSLPGLAHVLVIHVCAPLGPKIAQGNKALCSLAGGY